MVNFNINYLENIRNQSHIYPNVKPGYMRELLPENAPIEGEDWPEIFDDIERVIMPGVSKICSCHYCVK